MLKNVLILFVILSYSMALDTSKKSITLGSFLTQEQAETIAQRFPSDTIYIKISDKQQNKVYFVVYSMNLDNENLDDKLYQYQQTLPSAYITSQYRINKLYQLFISNSDELYIYSNNSNSKVDKSSDNIEKTIDNEQLKKEPEEEITNKTEEYTNATKTEQNDFLPKKEVVNNDIISINKTYLYIIIISTTILIVTLILFLYKSAWRKYTKDENNKFKISLDNDVINLKREKEKLYQDIARYEKKLEIIKQDIDLRTKGHFSHRIYHKQAFLNLSDAIVKMANREHIPVSILFINITNMDFINEQYDISISNEILNTFTSVLDFHTRNSDIIAKFNEDTFSILLPYTNKEGARILHKKLLNSIKHNTTVKIDDNNSIDFEVKTFLEIIKTENSNTVIQTIQTIEKNFNNSL